MSESDAVRKASEIAQATEWSGDPRMNFLTAISAARVLQSENERLRAEIERLQNVLLNAAFMFPDTSLIERLRAAIDTATEAEETCRE
jgi:hypothetical protein